MNPRTRLLAPLAALTLAALTHAASPKGMADAPDRDLPADADERGFFNGADACFNAPTIAGFGTWSFSLTGATTDGLPHAACASANSAQIWRDVWYRWESPVSAVVSVETCGLTSTDTRIAVYAPSSLCTPISEYLLGCNDDACSTQSRVTFVAMAGQTYLVRVGKFGVTEPNATGSGSININSAAAPDVCAGSIGCQDPILTEFAWPSHSDYRAADDLFISASGAITGLCWWGTYSVNAPALDAFRVTYWTSVAGRPGTPIASFDQGAALGVQRVYSGQFNFGNLPNYQYAARHAPVPVMQGQTIWVEVRNRIGDTWFWQTGAPGNGALADSTQLDTWSNSQVINNLALCVDLNNACVADANGDGLVNFQDLNIVISGFNSPCP